MGKNSKRHRNFREGAKINQDVCSRCNTEMGALTGPAADEKLEQAMAAWAKDGIAVAQLKRTAVYQCPNCGTIHVDAKRDDNSGHMTAFATGGEAGPPPLPREH